MKVVCDQETDGGGWTVVQRRADSQAATKDCRVKFDKDWQQYKDGFGHVDPSGEFWMGLELMHLFTDVLGLTVSHEL